MNERPMFSTVVRRWTIVAFATLSAGMAWTDHAAAQDPVERINRAAESDLPRGDGLAATLPPGTQIDAHRDVIFADDFESGQLGARWDEIRNHDGNVLALADPPASENLRDAVSRAPIGDRSLKVTALLSENTGGGLTTWFESSERIFIRFYTLFDKHCDYVHHFCTLRANKSLQGGDRWSGFGGAGLRPAGDARFSTALEPWGNWGNFSPPGRWNFYTYWHEMDASGDGKYWGNSFQPEEQPNIERGRWICAELMLKHNTPGLADGEQAFWIDGELRGHWRGFKWRTSGGLQANAFTLESYVTDRWTKNRLNVVYFDNVVIARSYIGPAATQASVNGE